MNIVEVRRFIENINTTENGSVSVKLVDKVQDNYQVFEPALLRQLRREIKTLYLEVFNTRLYELPQEVYNPNVAQDGHLATAPTTVARVDATIDQLLDEDNIHGDLDEMDLDDINFYCISFNLENESLYIFRRFTKMKKLRNGLLTAVEDNTLSRIENELFIGLDRDIDIVVFRNESLIVNRFALQTIFNLRDYFTERATEALNRVQVGNIITNFTEFREDCLADRQASKRITKIINTPGRIEGFLDHAHLLPQVIDEASLELELNQNGQIIYTRDRQIRSQILFVLADAYYLSLMLGRVGEDLNQ